MTLTEFLAFKGTPEQLEEYQVLLKRLHRQETTIGRLSGEIYDEEDSISVFTGELSERDKVLLKKHQDRKHELEEKRSKAIARYEATEKRLLEFTR